jgi:hypothetical protein
MQQHFPMVLVGNALSLMVAATRLAQQGADVAIVNSGRNWGGHFTTMTCKGVVFDPGMVLHEFTSYRASPRFEDVRTYNPATKNDAGRFCDTVRRCVSAYQEIRDIAVPKMYVDGAVNDDILIANALSSMEQLRFRDSIESELLDLLKRPVTSPWHASHKYSNEDFKQLDYQTASLINHGATFHGKLIEPYCKKVLNIATENVVALYHRVAWLPLFYPETLLSYLQDTPQALPPTIFSYPHNERVGDFSNKLRSEIESSGRVTIIPESLVRVVTVETGGYKLEFSNRAGVSTDHLAWSNNLSDLLRVLGLQEQVASYQKCSIALAFFRIPTIALQRDFTVLNVVDPEIGIYRITNQSGCAGVESAFVDLVAEVNPDYAAEKMAIRLQAALPALVVEDLVKLGIVNEPTHVDCLDVRQLNNALMLPTGPNRRILMQEIDAAEAAAPQVALLGPASGFFSSSFNDQVVQGLKLASVWGHPR